MHRHAIGEYHNVMDNGTPGTQYIGNVGNNPCEYLMPATHE